MIVSVSIAALASAAVRAAVRKGEINGGGAPAMKLWAKVLNEFGGRGTRDVLVLAKPQYYAAVRLDGRFSVDVVPETAKAWMAAEEARNATEDAPAPPTPIDPGDNPADCAGDNALHCAGEEQALAA